MLGSFFSDVSSGDPMALLIVAVVLGVVAYFWQTEVKKAKEKAETAGYHRDAEVANMGSRYAKKDIDPIAVPDINRIDHQAKVAGETAWEERRQALEAIRLALLDQHRTIDTLKENLLKLHREEHAIRTGSDPEPVKRKDLKLIRDLTSAFEEDIRVRVRRIVPDEDRKDVRGSDQDSDSRERHQSETEGTPHPPPAAKARVGF